MKIKLGKNQPLPKYQTSGSAAFDLCATADTNLDSSVHMMDLEIACEIPQGYYGKLVVRSSMAKRGIMLAHGTGIIDSDYRGNIKAPIYSRAAGGSRIEKGERIVQLLICPVEQVQLEVVEELQETDRGAGGFGSTNGPQKTMRFNGSTYGLIPTNEWSCELCAFCGKEGSAGIDCMDYEQIICHGEFGVWQELDKKDPA
ncbi:deoxyuridine 5'-triphosphate nucleotidohydrolase [Vibrio maritimus]|uniref:dUTP diphosphatase n=1 Tax=Vibrio maritimus TaxID=990268 RepID=A0A090SGC1_9VIBR|nr:deoxyuridine 5'-triphosphate nucleotidohydrolase [Vibrio maritimus]